VIGSFIDNILANLSQGPKILTQSCKQKFAENALSIPTLIPLGIALTEKFFKSIGFQPDDVMILQ
jgi:hypothetical protein